ncbi:hypothetical protein H6P81_015841 [Aristolochia fimbriata]|uniref:Uncharacterized protein n=1 Tax=Aristolochia fimbriata TaxID=158543 RepID=A0AAV7E7X0_ARIFI|nr:hypothetical protein H6P81_015841 [Aristolochia fimbriata]
MEALREMLPQDLGGKQTYADFDNQNLGRELLESISTSKREIIHFHLEEGRGEHEEFNGDTGGGRSRRLGSQAENTRGEPTELSSNNLYLWRPDVAHLDVK